jgi:hypothetical protein
MLLTTIACSYGKIGREASTCEPKIFVVLELPRLFTSLVIDHLKVLGRRPLCIDNLLLD